MILADIHFQLQHARLNCEILDEALSRPHSRPLYERYFVVVAYLGAKPTGGFEITIDRMTPVGRTVRVAISTVDASGSLATQIVTAPVHAVMVERSELRRKGDLAFEMWEGEQLFLTRTYTVS